MSDQHPEGSTSDDSEEWEDIGVADADDRAHNESEHEEDDDSNEGEEEDGEDGGNANGGNQDAPFLSLFEVAHWRSVVATTRFEATPLPDTTGGDEGKAAGLAMSDATAGSGPLTSPSIAAAAAGSGDDSDTNGDKLRKDLEDKTKGPPEYWRAFLFRDPATLSTIAVPWGTRNQRFSWEHPALDIVTCIDLKESDVLDVRYTLEDMTPRLSVTDLPTVKPAIGVAIAILRRFFGRFPACASGYDMLEPAAAQLVQLYAIASSIGDRAERIEGLWEAVSGLHQQVKQVILSILGDIMSVDPSPVSLADEARRCRRVQREEAATTDRPRLDLKDRLAGRIRRCPAYIAASEADDAAFEATLLGRLPRVMTVPHPLATFAVRPRNPLIAVGTTYTCDLCYVPRIRAALQAVSEADGPPAPTAAPDRRSHFELVKNCIGFDFCVACAVYVYYDALRMVARGVLALSTEGGAAASVQGMGAVLAACTGDDDATDDRDNTTSATGADKAVENLLAQTPCSPLPPSSGLRVLGAAVSVRECFRRDIIRCNNTLHVAPTARVLVTASGAAQVVLRVAISPLGARPIARLWSRDLADAAIHAALAGAALGDQQDGPAAAADVLCRVGDVMRPFFERALRCGSRQVLSQADALAMHDDEGESVCAICLEPLLPAGEEADAATGGSLPRDESVVDFLDGSASAKTPLSPFPAPAPSGDFTSGHINEASAVTRAVLQTRCRHWFHAQCMEQYVLSTERSSCPLCRTEDALSSLSARRFRHRDGPKSSSSRAAGAADGAEADGERAHAPEEEHAATEEESDDGGAAVTPAMIAAETIETLATNVYEVRVPLPGGFCAAIAGSTHTPPSPLRLQILTGTLTSLNGRYSNVTDLGALCLINVDICSF